MHSIRQNADFKSHLRSAPADLHRFT